MRTPNNNDNDNDNNNNNNNNNNINTLLKYIYVIYIIHNLFKEKDSQVSPDWILKISQHVVI